MFYENFSCFLSFSPFNPCWEVKIRKKNIIDVKGKAKDEKLCQKQKRWTTFHKETYIEFLNSVDWTQQSCNSVNWAAFMQGSESLCFEENTFASLQAVKKTLESYLVKMSLVKTLVCP